MQHSGKVTSERQTKMSQRYVMLFSNLFFMAADSVKLITY